MTEPIGHQTTKLQVKLYDQMDEEDAVEEARNPMFGVLGVFMFGVVFLTVCMGRFVFKQSILLRTMHTLSRQQHRRWRLV